jgi:hypothetical protein
VDLEAFELVLLRRPQDAPFYPGDVLQRIQKPWARSERSWSDILPASGRGPDVVWGKALARTRA